MFPRKHPQKIRSIKHLARRNGAASSNASIQNPLHGFHNKRRSEGINVASLRTRTARLTSLPHNHVHHEGLSRSPSFIGSNRRRGG